MPSQVYLGDINESFAEFGVVKETGKIRFGLMAIKNVGIGPIEEILRAREEGGRFISIEDFAKRVGSQAVNKKTLESLIKCGAMDSLGEREVLLANVERILSFSAKSHGTAASGQIDLFGGMGVEMPPLKLEPAMREATTREKLSWEKELLGIYISEHPMNEYSELLFKLNATPIAEITDEMSDKIVKIGGVITTIHKIQTRSKENMIFAGLEDSTGNTEILVFPKLLAGNEEMWQSGKVLLVKGKVSTKDGQIKVILEKAKEVSEDMTDEDFTITDPLISQSVKVDKDGVVSIYIPRGTSQEVLNDLKVTLASNKGDNSVFVYVPNGSSGPKKVKLPFGIKYSDKLSTQICKRLSGN